MVGQQAAGPFQIKSRYPILGSIEKSESPYIRIWQVGLVPSGCRGESASSDHKFLDFPARLSSATVSLRMKFLAGAMASVRRLAVPCQRHFSIGQNKSVALPRSAFIEVR